MLRFLLRSLVLINAPTLSDDSLKAVTTKSLEFGRSFFKAIRANSQVQCIGANSQKMLHISSQMRNCSTAYQTSRQSLFYSKYDIKTQIMADSLHIRHVTNLEIGVEFCLLLFSFFFSCQSCQSLFKSERLKWLFSNI